MSAPRESTMAEPTAGHRIVVIGAGFAGLGAAIRLKQRGVQDFVVLERADGVGGTWRRNTYPGCACDIPSDVYSFSFALEPDWSRRYARQAEILAYLKRCADAFGIRPHIRFGTDVLRAEWRERTSRWRVETTRGVFEASVLVSGHGPFDVPRWPEIPGTESFPGPAFHTADWRHDLDLAGARVALIGTGASGVQVLPHLREAAGRVTVFQRTPPWVLPRHDRPTHPLRRRLFRRAPLLQRLARQASFVQSELNHAAFAGPLRPWVGRLFERVARAHLHAQVADPALRADLTPGYRIGCKRVLFSDDFYPALQQPNVELVTAGIDRIDGNRLATRDGRTRTFDVLIAATGFRVTRPPIARLVFGRDGRRLDEAWSDGALHGTTAVGFPNFFALVGPNTGLGHNSIVYMIEAQLAYLLGALKHLEHLERGSVAAIEPRADAVAQYNARLQARLRNAVWSQGACTSWYLDAEGENRVLWPGRASEFRRALRRFPAQLYAPPPAERAPTQPAIDALRT